MPNAVDTGIMRGRMLANRTTKNVAGAAGVNITLDDLRYGVIELIGAITANIAVIFPAIDGLFVEVFNNTTGAFVITAKIGSSAGIIALQGKRQFLYLDGSEVHDAAGRKGTSVGQSISVTGDTSLTAAQAAKSYLSLTDGGLSADFVLTIPIGSMELGDVIWIDNATAFNATVKIGAGDTGIPLPGGTAAQITSALAGATHYGLPWNATLTSHVFPSAIGGAGARGLTLLEASQAVAASNITLTAAKYNAAHLTLTGTPGATRTITFPAAAGSVWIVTNNSDTAQLMKVVGDAGAGITIAAASRAMIRAGATVMERVTADAVLT